MHLEIYWEEGYEDVYLHNILANHMLLPETQADQIISILKNKKKISIFEGVNEGGDSTKLKKSSKILTKLGIKHSIIQ